MTKPDTTKIIQITSDAKTVFGLGSDEKMYQWNFLDASWHLFAVQRERETPPTAAPAPTTPAA